ncbi:hypothetical protein Aau02nite_78880 [Amorphoplanes auranticolor]|uniref:Uncharacterized protein n=2 Tax=Actinoplanes auranticolor TaxID=47988 RepID=A0A919VW64_9ACTN|nr:hypothetical protein Aau02nite_78880 [Actinoplanes auranticolor]
MGQMFREVGRTFSIALSPFAEVVLYVLNPVVGRLVVDARKKNKRNDSLLEDRLQELAGSMKKSSELVAEVEAALDARRAAVDQLRLEAETAQQIKDMSDEQRIAVANVLRAEVAREGKKTLWQGATVNGFFFALGVVVTVVVG